MQYTLDMRGCLDWMGRYSQISYSIVKTISVIFPVAFEILISTLINTMATPKDHLF